MLRRLFTFFKKVIFLELLFQKKTQSIERSMLQTWMEHSEHQKAVFKPVTLF